MTRSGCHTNQAQRQAERARRTGGTRATARSTLLCCLVFTAGCGGTQPINVATQPNVRPDRLVEFTYQDKPVQLDSVVISRDSISGIPWHDAARCCARIAYPLAAISQPKIRTFPAVGTIIGIALGIIFFWGYEVAIHVSDT